ncbi:hypothetical protein KC320_g258 [Hortaea werneckii]|nr:hypothetical protein KC320_g258 [Hortaea werneckii]
MKQDPHPLSSTFLALSTTLFSSAVPFSTTFSICVPAFFRSSGLTLLFNCIPLNFFCCFPRASRALVLAFSPALAASCTAAFLDSAVGGGMLITSMSGLAPSRVHSANSDKVTMAYIFLSD